MLAGSGEGAFGGSWCCSIGRCPRLVDRTRGAVGYLFAARGGRHGALRQGSRWARSIRRATAPDRLDTDPGVMISTVVGEGTRCWFGNQFSLIAPKFAAYGVDLWVPELGGKFEARNP